MSTSLASAIERNRARVAESKRRRLAARADVELLHALWSFESGEPTQTYIAGFEPSGVIATRLAEMLEGGEA